MDTITINGEEYIKASEANVPAETLDGMEYCMVRTESAGVFAGYLEEKRDNEVTLRKARRIWYWAGAASLSQLATDGTSKPDECKFPCEVDTVILLGVVEIIPMTEKAKRSIKAVKVWKE